MAVFSILRNKYWQTVVSVVITIQVVNMSVDAVHPSPNFEDLTINEIETCAEFVLEVILGYDNAIKETHDHDHSSGKPSSPHILFASIAQSPSLSTQLNVVVIFAQSHYSDHLAAGFLMTFYPPPKFV